MRRAFFAIHASAGSVFCVCPPHALDAAQVKMTGHMQKSTQVMQQMNRLIKMGDIQATMQSMQKEMMKVRARYFKRLPQTRPLSPPLSVRGWPGRLVAVAPRAAPDIVGSDPSSACRVVAACRRA